MRFAKEQGIQTGPGRGSVGGSCLAWCLGITTIDPLKYDLPFERFLNPSRISVPDFFEYLPQFTELEGSRKRVLYEGYTSRDNKPVSLWDLGQENV